MLGKNKRREFINMTFKFNEKCSIINYPFFLWDYSDITLGVINQLKVNGYNEKEIVEAHGWSILEEADELEGLI